MTLLGKLFRHSAALTLAAALLGTVFVAGCGDAPSDSGGAASDSGSASDAGSGSADAGGGEAAGSGTSGGSDHRE